MSRPFWILLAVLGCAPGVAAQTLLRFDPAEAEGAALRLRVLGEHAGPAEPRAWPRKDCGWLFVRQEGTQQNFDALEPESAEPSVLRLQPEGSGPALVGWDPPPRTERVSAAELRAFLGERGAAKALPRELEALEPGATVELARLESLALIARASEAAPAPSAVALSKSGQRMELRPILDPSALPPGSDLAFKLYLPEGGSANVFCRAVQLDSRTVQELERLPDGTLRAKLAEPGPWMIEAHRLRAPEGAHGTAFELASTTLVFVVPPAPKGDGK